MEGVRKFFFLLSYRLVVATDVRALMIPFPSLSGGNMAPD